MNTADPQTVTLLLNEAREGNSEAFNRVFEDVYDELQHLARNIRLRKSDNTLDTTALVHEAYIKLILSKEQNWENRAHFFRIAACAMRQVLIKQVRYKSAEKRNEGIPAIPFNEELYLGSQIKPDTLLSLDQALKELEKLNERPARVFECRFFAGMSVKETAAALEVSEPTVKRDWRLARAWLVRALGITD